MNIQYRITGEVYFVTDTPVKAEIINNPEVYRYSSAIDYEGGKGLLNVIVV